MSDPATTGGRVLADALVSHGASDVFLIPGLQLDWAVEGLRQRAEALTLYVPRHEQATTYMADGYYRASGRVGVAMVVPGPGVLNASAGLATAYAANSKVVFIAGQIHSRSIGRDYGNMHEIRGQTELIGNLTKWHRCVTDVECIADTVEDAFNALHAGRPRPVGIEIAYEQLQAIATGVRAGASVRREALSMPDPQTVDRICECIDKARRPVLYVGSGAASPDASAALRRLAEKTSMPVVMSENGRGALDERHVLAMNTLAGRALFDVADLVVVVGSRFMGLMTPTPSWNRPGAKYVFVNIDAADLESPRRPTIALKADARSALDAIASQVRPRVALTEAEALAVKRWAAEQVAQVEPQNSYACAIRRALPEDGIFVNELTQVGYLARVAFPVYGPRSYITPGYQATLGYGFPTAIGAAVGGRGRRVVSVTGDGGFGWNLQELATARRYRVPVALVVFNDGHFGNVRLMQKCSFGADCTAAVELENPDFLALAAAFGVPACRVTQPAALEGALRDAFTVDGPMLIEVPVGEMPSPWHLLRLEPLPGTPAAATPPHPLIRSD
jgi:acetolactate synthase I/II/III large subunit